MPNISREVLFNDGEDLEYGDLNNVQRFLRSALYDQTVSPLARIVRDDTSPVSSYLYCLGSSMQPFVTNNSRLQFQAGTIFQYLGGAIDGLDPQFLSYYFDGTEWSASFAGDGGVVTMATADATNPRIDMVQVKLEQSTVEIAAVSRDFKDGTTGALSSQTFRKVRNVKATFSIKNGTPAANPAEPTPDAGYVKLCSYWVSAASTSIAQDSKVFDYRVPVGLRGYSQFAAIGALYAPGNWTAAADGSLTAAGANVLLLPCPVTTGRVFRATLIGAMNGGTVKWKRTFLNNFVTEPTPNEEIDSVIGTGVVPWPVTYTKPGAAGVGGVRVIMGNNTQALWANGYRRDHSSSSVGAGRLYLEVTASGAGDIVNNIEWEICG